jgi:uracil-DNA glycosylase
MWFDEVWDLLISRVFCLPSKVKSENHLFNFYLDSLPGIDLPDGASIRQTNLYNFISSLPAPPSTLMVGEAPGWRGCRFSGIPFTSEALLASAALPFEGKASTAFQNVHHEISASIFWKTIIPFHPDFFVWNCLPLHPHLPSNPLSNRSPTTRELQVFLPLLSKIMALVMPRRVLAIGRTAQRVLSWLDISAIPIRHPSHGGAQLFRAAILASFCSKI